MLFNLVQSLFLYEKFQLFEDRKPNWKSHCAWLKQMHLAGDISERNETKINPQTFQKLSNKIGPKDALLDHSQRIYERLESHVEEWR